MELPSHHHACSINDLELQNLKFFFLEKPSYSSLKRVTNNLTPYFLVSDNNFGQNPMFFNSESGHRSNTRGIL